MTTNNNDICNVLKNNDKFNIKSENVKLDDIRPRFRKCKELGCDKMYNCQEKIETHFTNSGWTMDYFCKRKNTFVYWE